MSSTVLSLFLTSVFTLPLMASSAADGIGSERETIRSCPNQIVEGAHLGIKAIPGGSANSYKRNFCKYTELVAPSGKKIRFFAQNKISNEQMVRARRILNFYLTDVPGSQYGTDKSDIFNKMATNKATMIMMNGSDDGEPPADGQTLYETENIVEGSAAYITNDPRDAAFEEILHLMHDTGIGVDGANSYPGVRPAYQTEVRKAMQDAIAPGVISEGAQKGLWGAIDKAWLRELRDENSLTQEYLASVIDTYYGLAGYSSAEGSNDLYVPQSRRQIRFKDKKGWKLVGGDNPRKFFSEYVTYEARIDSGFSGTFFMSYNRNKKYTHKSRYLLDAALTGDSPTGLRGNNQNNKLTGNSGKNKIRGASGDDTLRGAGGTDVLLGGSGTDTAVFTGPSYEYTIHRTNVRTIVTDQVPGRDGRNILKSIETLQFSDGQQQN